MHRKALYLIAAMLILASGASFAFGNIARCMFIGFSNFKNISNNLYVSEHVNEVDYPKIKELIANARLRITDVYGKPMANPVIIVADTKKETGNFGLHDIPGTTFFLPWRTYLVLNFQKAGIDVVSHELVHAEIVYRVGYFKRVREIPTWFDEGAALQVDWRPQYKEIKHISRAELARVRTLNTPDKFWSDNKIQNIKNYQSAKVAVAQFYQEHPSVSLYDIMSLIHSGKHFDDVVPIP